MCVCVAGGRGGTDGVGDACKSKRQIETRKVCLRQTPQSTLTVIIGDPIETRQSRDEKRPLC